jgi:hypothetical protein
MSLEFHGKLRMRLSLNERSIALRKTEHNVDVKFASYHRHIVKSIFGVLII